MILDSSAVVAVLLEEEGHDRLETAMDAAPLLAIGAPTLLETGMVMVGFMGQPGRAVVAQFLDDRGIEATPFGELHCEAAFAAFIRYGKGRHPAKLNYGDCMTYATARLADLPLLCTGEDFRQTDLAIA